MEVNFDPEQSFTDGSEWTFFFVCSPGCKQTSSPATLANIWQSVIAWVADRLLDRIDRAAGVADTPLKALQAMFMSHMAFVIEYLGVPRMMFGELQHARATPAKQAAYTLMRRYAERVSTKLEEGKVTGEISSDTDTPPAAILFIGTIQGLVIHSMISGDFKSARANADEVLAVYLRCVRTWTLRQARSHGAQ